MSNDTKFPYRRRDYPVFVLGSPRSGTSTLAHLLKTHFEYDGHSEGHVLNLLHKLLETTRVHFEHLGVAPPSATPTTPTTPPTPSAAASAGGDPNAWLGTFTAGVVGEAAIAHGVQDLFMSAIARTYGPRWFDKTPGPDFVRGARSLQDMYPEARFIHVIRHPVSNVDSRLRKFPQYSFEQHCQDWVDSAVAWLQVRPHLRVGTYVELHTSDLSSDPEGTFAKVATLLEGHPVPEHVAAKPALTRFLTIERTSQDPTAAPGLDDVPWTTEQKRQFVRTCSGLMQVYGFSLEGGAGEKERPQHRVLPLPYGQANVEIKFGATGGVWPEHRGEDLWIFLHPSKPDTEQTRVIYRDTLLTGVSRISARVSVISERAPTVRFSITVRSPDGGEVIASAETDCAPLAEAPLTLDLPELRGAYQVVLSSQTTTDSTENAWALMLPPTLEQTARVTA